MRKYAALIVLVSLLTLAILQLDDNNLGQGRFDQSQPSIEQMVASLSLEEKIGQLMIVGFDGKTPSEYLDGLISQYNIGGFILFQRNIDSEEQLRLLTSHMQRTAQEANHPAPLFITADEEGGIVSRLPVKPKFPNMMAVGATENSDLAFSYGIVTARRLRELGLNMNLAPVLDVNNNPKNPVIGVRSFGEEPQLVAELGAAYVDGLQSEGVLSVGKHFPGHGDTAVDSHYALPTIPFSLERLNQIELLPFRQAIEHNIAGIMSAHIIFSELDNDYPATLSYPVLTGLLREELGFNGLIITDAVEMQAITNHFSPYEVGVSALQAGADIILVGWPPSDDMLHEIRRGIIEAVRAGALTEERIDQSVRRVLTIKSELDKSEATPRDHKLEESLVRTIAQESVTLVKDEANLIPVAEGKVIHLVLPRLAALTGAEEGAPHLVWAKEFEETNPTTTNYYALNPSQLEINTLLNVLPSEELVVFETYRSWEHPNQVELASALLERKQPIIVVSLREPYDLAAIPQAPTYLTAYSTTSANLRASAQLIVGRNSKQSK